MKTTWQANVAAAAMSLALASAGEANAQQYYPNAYYQPNLYNNPNQAYQLNNFYYYPYYYFPHNYWPSIGPRWPEAPGEPYMPPPAYMAFPPYKPPLWNFDYWHKMPYYRGSHFLLDVF